MTDIGEVAAALLRQIDPTAFDPVIDATGSVPVVERKTVKVTFEMPEELKALLELVAEAHGISNAGALTRLLYDALQRYASGDIDFDGYLQPSRSPRYKWVVRIDVDELLREIVARNPR